MMNKIALLSIFALSLTACNGQNPTNRDSDPLRKYSNLKNDVPAGPQAKGDGTKEYCPTPYSLKIFSDVDEKKELKGQPLQFVAGQQSVFYITFSSIYGDLKVELADAPNGLRLNEKSQGQWELSWSPTKQDSNLVRSLDLVISGVKNRCVTGDLVSSVNIAVNGSDTQPKIKVTGFDFNQVHKPSDKIQFRVEEIDTTLAEGSKPSAPLIEYLSKNRTGEIPYLNAESAVTCAQPQITKTKSFLFNCTFDLSQLAKTNGSQASGIKVSGFNIFVKSATGEESVRVPAQAIVSFPENKPNLVKASAKKKVAVVSTKDLEGKLK